MDEEDILQEIERQSRATQRRVKDLLISEGRSDLADDLEHRFRDIDLGIAGAKTTWKALSKAQRETLECMGKGDGTLTRCGQKSKYYYRDKGFCPMICGLPTARNLCARELIVCDGTAFDPELRFVLTERGRFVLKHGRK